MADECAHPPVEFIDKISKAYPAWKLLHPACDPLHEVMHTLEMKVASSVQWLNRFRDAEPMRVLNALTQQSQGGGSSSPSDSGRRRAASATSTSARPPAPQPSGWISSSSWSSSGWGGRWGGRDRDLREAIPPAANGRASGSASSSGWGGPVQWSPQSKAAPSGPQSRGSAVPKASGHAPAPADDSDPASLEWLGLELVQSQWNVPAVSPAAAASAAMTTGCVCIATLSQANDFYSPMQRNKGFALLVPLDYLDKWPNVHLVTGFRELLRRSTSVEFQASVAGASATTHTGLLLQMGQGLVEPALGQVPRMDFQHSKEVNLVCTISHQSVCAAVALALRNGSTTKQPVVPSGTVLGPLVNGALNKCLGIDDDEHARTFRLVTPMSTHSRSLGGITKCDVPLAVDDALKIFLNQGLLAGTMHVGFGPAADISRCLASADTVATYLKGYKEYFFDSSQKASSDLQQAIAAHERSSALGIICRNSGYGLIVDLMDLPTVASAIGETSIFPIPAASREVVGQLVFYVKNFSRVLARDEVYVDFLDRLRADHAWLARIHSFKNDRLLLAADDALPQSLAAGVLSNDSFFSFEDVTLLEGFGAKTNFTPPASAVAGRGVGTPNPRSPTMVPPTPKSSGLPASAAAAGGYEGSATFGQQISHNSLSITDMKARLTRVEEELQRSKAAEAQMASHVQGKGQLIDVVTAISSAEASLETVMAVRDQVISAYQEIMRMPI
mgnify:CR=1 FL=1